MILAEQVSGLWKWPNFLLLVGYLGYLIKKHGGPLLNARSQKIHEGLQAGEKAKQEAEARAAAVQKKIANLDSEIAGLRTAAHAVFEREAGRIRREAEAEIARIEHHTAMETASIGKQAKLELRQFTAALAMDLAERKVRARMSPNVQGALLAGFTADMAARSGGSAGSQHA